MFFVSYHQLRRLYPISNWKEYLEIILSSTRGGFRFFKVHHCKPSYLRNFISLGSNLAFSCEAVNEA